MTLARAVLAVIGEHNTHNYDFHTGLAFGLQDIVRIPRAEMVKGTHSETGQPTLQVWKFPDGSTVTRTWNPKAQELDASEGE